MSDSTELTDARLRAALDDAERANRLKDQVLAALSHDLRAPLATMMMWERALRDDPRVRDRALDAMRESLLAQSRMIDDLLDIVHALDGTLHIDLRPVALDRELAGALERIEPVAAAKQVAIAVAAGGPLGAVRGDAHRLGQVLDTLLANAVKYTEPGGRIEVTGRTTDGKVAIVVTDTGRGISPDAASRLFEPFSRDNEERVRERGGLGLGLAIAREVIALHGGTVLAHSGGPGRGARFTLSLPAGVERITPPSLARALAPRSLAGVRVLVVDDDDDLREALALVLGAAGAIVTCAATSAGARAAMLDGHHEVFVSDIELADADGYALVSAIRAMSEGRRICAVALTAHATGPDIARARAAGFDAHVAKPADPDVLVAAILRALAGSAQDP